ILGWRFFIFESKNLIAAAHVMRTDQGELRLSELNEGPFVGNTMDALQTILSKSKNKGEAAGEIPPFELLLVIAPAVYFVGWWARFDSEGVDWVLPVEPTLRGLDSTPIPSSQLLPALQKEYIRASRYRLSS